MDLKIKELIYRKDKLVSKEDCLYFINIFEKYINLTSSEESIKYIEGQNHKIEKDNYKVLNLSRLSENQEIKQVLNLSIKYIGQIIKEYVEYLKLNISSAIDARYMNSTSHVRILKYETGHFIKDHLDTDLDHRASCTLNLNEEYEGGEFTFFSGKQIETFKTGDAMIFPAEHIWVHGTKPVTKGTRYAINCFLKNIDKQ
jgi:predicted 2-oxoglutarate/Fe(II)-dependent dioxygenase YbiX